jgi:predicted ester cyclase
MGPKSIAERDFVGLPRRVVKQSKQRPSSRNRLGASDDLDRVELGVPAMTRDEITREQAEDLKHQVERGFNLRDTRLIEELLADHLVDHNQVLGGVDLRQRMARVLEVFEDAELTIDDYLFQGTAMAWRWTIRGTHSKRVLGVEPTGRRVTISGLSAAVVRNGKIVEHLEFSDDAGLMAQLEAGR